MLLKLVLPRSRSADHIDQRKIQQLFHRIDHHNMILSLRQFSDADQYSIIVRNAVAFIKIHLCIGLPHGIISLPAVLQCIQPHADPHGPLYAPTHRKALRSPVILVIDQDQSVRKSGQITLHRIIDPILPRCSLIKMKSVRRIKNRHLASCFPTYRLCCQTCHNTTHRHMTMDQVKILLL